MSNASRHVDNDGGALECLDAMSAGELAEAALSMRQNLGPIDARLTSKMGKQMGDALRRAGLNLKFDVVVDIALNGIVTVLGYFRVGDEDVQSKLMNAMSDFGIELLNSGIYSSAETFKLSFSLSDYVTAERERAGISAGSADVEAIAGGVKGAVPAMLPEGSLYDGIDGADLERTG